MPPNAESRNVCVAVDRAWPAAPIEPSSSKPANIPPQLQRTFTHTPSPDILSSSAPSGGVFILNRHRGSHFTNRDGDRIHGPHHSQQQQQSLARAARSQQQLARNPA